MQITFTDKDGIILEIIRDDEIGDLSKPIARASFLEHMAEVAERCREIENN